jgi:hypothetical protein
MNFHSDESFGNHQEESWNQREDNVVTENKRPILEANSKGTYWQKNRARERERTVYRTILLRKWPELVHKAEKKELKTGDYDIN